MRPSADGISPITFFPYEQIKKGNHVTFGHTGINQIHLIYGIPSKDLKNMEMTYWKMDEIQKKICANCEIENPEAKLCGRCKRVYYCGQECQTIHWKNIHKQLCQPPEKKNLNFTPLNEKQKKTIPLNIYQQQDFNDPEKLLGIYSNKFQNTFEKDKSYCGFLSFEEDVVVAFGKYSEKTIRDLKEKGYSGLKTVEDTLLNKLLDEQNYSELLNYIWTEEKIGFKIEWLREYAEKGHVILMFETARAIAELTEVNEKRLLEAYRWRTLGSIHAYLDASCFSDENLVEVSSSLEKNCVLDHLFKDYSKKECKKIINKIQKQKNKYIHHIQIKEALPSPKWLVFQSQGVLSGKNTLLPEQQWQENRSQSLQKLKENFK